MALSISPGHAPSLQSLFRGRQEATGFRRSHLRLVSVSKAAAKRVHFHTLLAGRRNRENSTAIWRTAANSVRSSLPFELMLKPLSVAAERKYKSPTAALLTSKKRGDRRGRNQ